MQMLEEFLRRLQADHLDVWRGFMKSCITTIYAQDGVLEALSMAKQHGKVRFVGCTGHKNPSIHLEMLKRGYAFDTIQT